MVKVKGELLWVQQDPNRRGFYWCVSYIGAWDDWGYHIVCKGMRLKDV